MINFKELKKNIIKIKKKYKKKIVFTIGNTSKINNNSSYLTPIREFKSFIVMGANIYSEKEAIKLTRIIDQHVYCIFVDCEKKIPKNISISGLLSNIERRVKEELKNAKIFLYKGNDLTVESADNFLSYYFKDDLKGLGGKIISIIGAGNIGSKLALKLVERGANVIITRRNIKKLKTITKALNLIKPKFTNQDIHYAVNNYKAAQHSEIILGCSNSRKPTITKSLLKNCQNLKLIIDIGKGSVSEEAVNYAYKNFIKIYRLDVASSLLSMIESQINYEKIFLKKNGRKKNHDVFFVSGGQLGKKGDIVVDNINNPKHIYGIANGKGDFLKRFVNLSFKKFKNEKLYS
jgi:hypothetical protein